MPLFEPLNRYVYFNISGWRLTIVAGGYIKIWNETSPPVVVDLKNKLYEFIFSSQTCTSR